MGLSYLKYLVVSLVICGSLYHSLRYSRKISPDIAEDPPLEQRSAWPGRWPVSHHDDNSPNPCPWTIRGWNLAFGSACLMLLGVFPTPGFEHPGPSCIRATVEGKVQGLAQRTES